MNCQILPRSLFIGLDELGELGKQEPQFLYIHLSSLELLEALRVMLGASSRRYVFPLPSIC